MGNKLPPPADIHVIKLELIRIKILLEDPSRLRIAGDRKKNMDSLARLGITPEGYISYLNSLTYKNYLSGPSDDRDTLEEKCIWEFGTTIHDLDVYIKIKHSKEDNLLLISFHVAERPFVFRYS